MRCPLKHEGYKKPESAHGERGRRLELADAFQITFAHAYVWCVKPKEKRHAPFGAAMNEKANES